MGSATRNGWRLISAVLKSDNASRDTIALMDYAFNNFQPHSVVRAGCACTGAKVGGCAAIVAAAPVRDLTVPVPNTGGRITTRVEFSRLEAPVARGARVGNIIASVNGRGE